MDGMSDIDSTAATRATPISPNTRYGVQDPRRITANLLPLTALTLPQSLHKMRPRPILAVRVRQDGARRGVGSSLYSLKFTRIRTISIIPMVQTTLQHLI
jgi:hypothetical protein